MKLKINIKRSFYLIFFSLLGYFGIQRYSLSEREIYEEHINYHDFLSRDYEKVSSMKKKDRPDLAWELDFLLTMDPNTKKPERDRLLKAYREKKEQSSFRISSPGQSNSPWEERGPSNVGGRTRAIVFDPTSSNKVWAGGVTGGLWYNDDITDGSSQWVSIDDFWDNLAVTCIAFDPNDLQTIYVGTGEGWGTSSSRGAGVWKSSDGGNSWNQLSATSNYHFVNDIAVRDESNGDESGVLYVASAVAYHEGSNHGQGGVYASQDGGASFVSHTGFTPTDLSIAPDNRIWSGTADGRVMYSDDGSNWIESYDSGMNRVAISSAPSDENYIYALIADGTVVGEIVYSDDKGVSWTNVSEPADVDSGIPDTDFTRGQAWYDLVIAVDPNDESTVLVGGIDLFRSTNNGSSWGQISRWYAFSGTSSAVVHADQHAIVFKGAGSNEVVFGNDGGVYYSEDLANAASGSEIDDRNNGYNVTQFYSCAIHPDEETDFFLAGTQDNGTQRFRNAGINETVDVFGGDGGFCFIDQTDPSYQIVSYVYNYYGLSTNGGSSFNTNLQTDQNSGLFINPADYDDNLDILYSSKTSTSINRIIQISGTPSIETLSVSLGSISSHLRVSPFTSNSTTLFVGTLGGRVFKILNADGSGSNVTEITGDDFPNGSISCIELGASEDEVLVTFSNYGVTSVWYSQDGGNSWSSKEGDLPDMPVRWALFNPNNRNEVLLATELGVWRTSNISNATPTWSSSNDGLANVRVDMLQSRASDNEVIAATYGRGLFSSNGFQVESVPSANFSADMTVGCGETLTVSFSDESSSNPAITSWAWSFPGGTPSSSSEQNPPEITYDTEGQYDVSLTVTNSLGEATETKNDYIQLGTGFSLPFAESFESTTFPPDCWTSYRGTNNLGTVEEWVRSTVSASDGSASAYVQYENTGGSENTEDWLVTGQINLTNTSNSQLTFDAKQSYNSEFNSTYHVKVSTESQSDISSFTNLVSFSESDFQVTGFGSHSVDLSDYDGQQIYIAFVLEQQDGDNWYLDNVVVSGTTLQIVSSEGPEVCSGESTILSVEDNDSYTYQWMLNGEIITGATSAMYEATESGEYSVEVTTGQQVVEVGPMEITVNELPTISAVFSDQEVSCVGESVVVTISVSGDDLTYQWMKDGAGLSNDSNISGVGTAVLNLDNVTLSDQGDYVCRVSRRNCLVESDQVTIEIGELPAIVSQPENIEICATENISFAITASGEDLSYQWYYEDETLEDDAFVSGSTTSTLSIVDAFEEDNGEYYCKVSSRCQTVITSEPASLTASVCLGIEDEVYALQFFPNPTEGMTSLSLTGISNAQTLVYAVYSMDGRLIEMDRVSIQQRETDTLTVNMGNYTNGIYIIALNVDGQSSSMQVIKR